MSRHPFVLVVVVALAAADSDASDPVLPRLSADGSEVFRAMLFRAGVEPITSTDLSLLPDAEWETVIAVRLDTKSPADAMPRLSRLPGQIARSGGAVLVATNQPDADLPDLPGCGHARVDGRPVVLAPTAVALRPSPLVEQFSRLSGRPTPARFSLFADLPNVRLSAPSAIRISWTAQPADRVPRPSPLAGFTGGARFDRVDGPTLSPDEFLAVGTGGPTRVVVVADPGLFLNRSLVDSASEGTDNWELADRVVRYLRDDRRTRCLFLHNGDEEGSFGSLLAAPEPPLPLPPLSAIVDRLPDPLNRLIEQAQERDKLNRALLGNSPGDQQRSLRNVLRGLAVLAAVWAAWYVLRKVWKARQRPEPRRGSASPAPPDGAFTRRELELGRRDNLYEPARDLARDLFAAVGVHTDDGVRPELRFEAGQPGLERAVDELWRVGYGPPAAVSATRWQELDAMADRVRAAFAGGAVRVVPAGASA